MSVAGPTAGAPITGPAPMIEAAGVTKWFRDVVAVSEVSFAVHAGVTALLGPNGAGKSTVLRLLCGLTAPSHGTVRVLGADPRREPALSRRIGLVPQQETLFEMQTAMEFVRLAGVLHGLSSPGEAAVSALQVVELDPADQRPLSTYSKGMRQRVKVAQALVNDPDVLFLDEPLTGLDPRQRLHMVDLIRDLGAAGKCVLVSSHVLEEVQRFGSRVLVIAQGRLAAEGDFRAIRELMDDRPHRIRVRSDRANLLASALIANGLVVGVELVDHETLIVETNEVASFRHSIATAARDQGARLLELVPLDEDLESVFRYLVSSR